MVLIVEVEMGVGDCGTVGSRDNVIGRDGEVVLVEVQVGLKRVEEGVMGVACAMEEVMMVAV